MPNLKWSVFPPGKLAATAAEWDALNQDTHALPFMDSRAVQLMCREFGSGGELLAICRQGERMVAACVMHSKGKGRWQTFQPAQAPLGCWLQRPELEYEVLLSSLAKALPGLCILIGVTQQETTPRPSATRRLQTLDYIETARVSVNGTFAEYWQARGSNLRQNLKKQRNRLAREGLASRVEAVREPQAIGRAVDDYALLESGGWKGSEGTALHPQNSQGRFYRELFEYLAQLGDATVFRYFLRDRLVASDLCVHRHGVFVILKTAFDEAEKGLSPSLLLKEQMFEELFADGRTRRIEFYGRVMEWHRRWSEDIRTMYHVNFFRWPWLAAFQRRKVQAATDRNVLQAPPEK